MRFFIQIRTATLLSAFARCASAVAWSDAASLTAVFPTVAPTATTDPWQCATANISQYFDPPKPTGELENAIDSFASKIFDGCLQTSPTDPPCPWPDSSRWCGFTTAAPSTMLPAYSSFASAASSWWANHSSAAYSVAEECPVKWYDESMMGLLLHVNAIWLNQSIIHGGCIAEAQQTPGGSGSAPTGTPSSGATPSGSTPKPTGTPNGAPTMVRNAQIGAVAGLALMGALASNL